MSFVVVINGEEFQVRNVEFSRAGEDDTDVTWATMDVSVPEGILQGGENTLELARSDPGQRGNNDLLLRELWLELA